MPVLHDQIGNSLDHVRSAWRSRTRFSALSFPSLSSESMEIQLHYLGQHLCTLLLDDGECHPQERLLSTKTTPSSVASVNYLPSCSLVTQHYLEQLSVTWRRLHCALLSGGILYKYTYSTDYHHQLQNYFHNFRITLFVSIIFEWLKYKIYRGFLSLQVCAAGYALTYATILKLQLVNWTVVGLTAAKFKPLILFLDSESESELLYNWRLTANKFVSATSPLRFMTRDLFLNWTLAVIVRINIVSDDRMGLSLKVKAKVLLRLTASQSVYVGIKLPSGAQDKIFITVIQLWVCWRGAPSLTRRRVCRLKLLPVSPAQSYSGRSPVGLMTIFHCLRFETPPTWRARSPYLYITLKNRLAQLYPQALGSLFVASYKLQGHGEGTGTRLHAGILKTKSKSKSKLLYYWRISANQFVLGSRSLRTAITDFFSQLNPCGYSPYVTSSLTRKWVCLLWICLVFRQVYISHI
jgi:hypothetical protein